MLRGLATERDMKVVVIHRLARILVLLPCDIGKYFPYMQKFFTGNRIWLSKY